MSDGIQSNQSGLALEFLRQHFGGEHRQGDMINILETLCSWRLGVKKRKARGKIKKIIPRAAKTAYERMSVGGTVPRWVQEEIEKLCQAAAHG